MKRNRRAFRCTLLGVYRAFILAALLAVVPGLAAAEYKLQPGDVLDVQIAGIPDFSPHVSVGIEGNIGLPLAGPVKVGGASLAEARARIATELANKLYRQYTTDGREISHLILGGEVIVSVAEYNPVYVNGDISKPGAYPFRPGMTIRQAIALAGGYNPVRVPGTDPALQASDLQAQYRALSTQYEGGLALVWRLKRELGQADAQGSGPEGKGSEGPASQGSDTQPAVPPGIPDVLLKGELQAFEARKAERESRKAMLQDAVRKATLQLSLLTEKKTKDTEGTEADAADFRTVRDLFQKGLAPSSRVTDARRAALMSSEQLLQTISTMADVERQRDEYLRQIQQIDSQTQLEDLQKLQEANLHLAEIRANMKGISDKLALVGRLRPDTQVNAEITVYRKDANGPQRIAAADDLELTPGDVVDVVLPHQAEPGLVGPSVAAR